MQSYVVAVLLMLRSLWRDVIMKQEKSVEHIVMGGAMNERD